MHNGIFLSKQLMSTLNLNCSYRDVKKESVRDYGDQLIHLQDLASSPAGSMCTNEREEKSAVAECTSECTFHRVLSTNHSFLSTDTKFFPTSLLDAINGSNSNPCYNRVDATSLGPLPSLLMPNVFIAGQSQCTPYPHFHGSGRAHSEGYSSCSSNQSQTSFNISCQKAEHTCGTHIPDGVGDSWKWDWSSVDDFLASPPADYSDHASDSGFTAGDISVTQGSSEAISDLFSQCGSTSTPDSLCNIPQEEMHYTEGTVEHQEQHYCNGCHPIIDTAKASGSSCSVVGTVLSDRSPTHSPTPKRRRVVCRSNENGVVDRANDINHKIVLDFERYCNEFSRDTYQWLCYRESTVHAIGMSFLAAQKTGGVTETSRKSAMMKAITEMRKLGYAAESIHLGAYIMDKCLDSFHVAYQALPDVCAVSMVLGTKIEEYESLRPGTLNGLAGASKNKKRLCHIEKRIIHELASGLCFPTPLVLANFMLAHLHSNEEQARFVHYLLDLALLESRFRDEAGSRLAHAAVCISAAVVNNHKAHNSECRALIDAEHRLSNFTQMLCGSTRDVMGELLIEMEKAVDERNSVFVEYLAEDNRRLCFCEVSPALWNLIYKNMHIRVRRDKKSASTLLLA